MPLSRFRRVRALALVGVVLPVARPLRAQLEATAVTAAAAMAAQPCGADPRVAEALEGVGRGTRAYAQAAASARAAARGTARGYLGVRLSELSETRWTPEGRLVRYCAYPVVVSVEPASPAERAGLESGDTLVAYGTRDLVQGGAVALDRLLVPGEPLRVRLRRGGRTITRVITVGQRPAPQTWAYGAAPFGPMTSFPPRVPFASEPPPAVRVAVGPRPVREGGTARRPVARVEPFAVDLPWPAGEFDDRDDRGARTVERLRVEQQLGRRQASDLALLSRQMRVQVLTQDGTTLASGWAAGGSTALAGAQLVALDDDLREVLAGAPTAGDGPTRGVFVLKVLPGTPAAEAGLRAGDVVTAAAGRPVASPAGLQRVLAGRALAGRSAAGERREVGLRVTRAGVAREATLRW
jgi:serine protease Do